MKEVDDNTTAIKTSITYNGGLTQSVICSVTYRSTKTKEGQGVFFVNIKNDISDNSVKVTGCEIQQDFSSKNFNCEVNDEGTTISLTESDF